MTDSFAITDVSFAAARPKDVKRGVVGWASFVLNGGLRVAGVRIRKTVDGRLCLSYPARSDSRGRRRFFIHPVSDSVRRSIEHQVFEAIGLPEEASR